MFLSFYINTNEGINWFKKNKNKALGNKDCLFRVIKNNDYY